MEVPSAVLLKLVCANCDGYLSRGPVHLMDNAKYRCGRCLLSEGEHGTRIQAYEKLAKLMTFPCRYQHNGCPHKVRFVENEAHEEACPYREYICPRAESGHCEWKGIQTELLDGSTTESSTAESNSQGTSSANTHNTTPVQTLEAIVPCGYCLVPTEPVYRGGWMCKNHAAKWRACENTTKGCTYSGVGRKYEKHEIYYCHYSSRCRICSEKLPSTTLDTHYTEAHSDITHRAGTVCTVGPVEFEWKYFIIDSELGRVMCAHCFNVHFYLHVFTPLLNEQLHKYRCALEISQPDTGHAVTCTVVVRYDWACDWYARISHTDFKMCSKNKLINIKINFTKIEDPSEIIL